MTRKSVRKTAARARASEQGGKYQSHWRKVGTASATDALVAEAREWASDLIRSWRAAWLAAPQSIRDEVSRLPLPHETPTRAVVRLRVDDDSPVAIFAVEFYASPEVTDLDVQVVVLDSPSDADHGLDATIEHYWRNARTNWHPGRVPDKPLNPWAASMGPLGGPGGSFIVVPGGPRDLAVASLIQHFFRDPEAAVVPLEVAAPARPKHLYDLGQEREDTAIERWMYGHCADVLEQLGLPFGWWCGLWLRRDEVFGDGLSGDIDILAGPLTLDFDDAELACRVRAEASARPLATNPGFNRNVAIMTAAQEGHVVWPPKLDTIVAV